MIRRISDIDRFQIYSIIKKEFGVDYKDNVYTNWYIYEINNIIVGFINYDTIYDKAQIEYIFVDEKYRQSNIATQLLKKMIEDLVSKNIKNITLEVRIDNNQAIKFYEKNGFEKVSIRKNYYKGTDGILMLKSW